MLKFICVASIIVGAIIMAVSIVKHSKSVARANAISKKKNDFNLLAYKFSLGLMCFFFLGYVCSGSFIALSSKQTMGDLVLAQVYMFGAIFVYIMIESQRQVIYLHTSDVLSTVTDSIDNMIHVVDPENYEILFINQPLAKSLGKEPADLIGKTCWKTLKKDKSGPCEQCPTHRMEDDNYDSQSPFYWESKDEISGKIFFVTSTMVTWVDDRNVLLCNMMDVSERKKQEQTLKTCAMSDKLTGAYNRTWGHQLLDQMFLPGSQADLPATFCFMDIDGLKNVNDTYGHEAGDELLCRMVKSLKFNVRKQDILIRWGGDEFVLILNCGIADAEKIMQKIESYVVVDNIQLEPHQQLRFSYGLEEISTFDDVRWESFVSKADKKMYRQKTKKKQKPAKSHAQP